MSTLHLISDISLFVAWAALFIVFFIQKKRIKELSGRYNDLLEKGWREHTSFGKVYRRNYKYMVIENAGDNGTLNNTAQKYHDDGYDLDREKSTDRLLVFVKSEEVKGKFID